MKKSSLVLLLALVLSGLGLLGYNKQPWPDVTPDAGDRAAMLNYCDKGGRAVGWNAAGSCWLATCGKWNWTAEKGSSSNYELATTQNGNSWKMQCLGPGNAVGDPPEEVVCPPNSAGLDMQMYKGMDWMIAWQETCLGGTVYLGSGAFHNAGCGRSSSQVANGCPWLPRDWTHQQHRVQTLGNIKFVGAGAQRTDAWIHGIDPAKTMIIMDHGRGGDTGDPDFGGDGIGLDRRAHLSGGSFNNRQCKTGQETGPLECMNNQDVKGRISGTRYARSGNFTGTCKVGDASCSLENTISSGVCEYEPTIRCTSHTGDRPSEGDSGGCTVVGGNCVGIADMIAADLAASKEVIGHITFGSCSYGDGALGVDDGKCSESWDAVAVKVSGVTGSPGANPRGLTFDFTAFPIPKAALAEFHSSHNFDVVDPELWHHDEGGWEDVGFMAANPPGRDDDGDGAYYCIDLYDSPPCPTTPQMSGDPDGKCDLTCDNYDAADKQDCTPSGITIGCDAVEPINFGVAYKGGYRRISVQHAGGGVMYSVVDGIAGAIYAHLYDSEFFELLGVLSDASGWDYRGNTWRDSDCGSSSCLKVGFTNNFSSREEKVYRVTAGGGVIDFTKARGASIRDIIISESQTNIGLFVFRNGAGIDISGVRGHGNVAPMVFAFAPYNKTTLFDINIGETILDSMRLYSSLTARIRAVIGLTDFNGSGSYVGGRIRGVNITNVHVNAGGTASDSPSFLALDGGTGDDTTAANGAGRTIDDYRDGITVRDSSLHAFDSENVCGVSLVNAVSGSATCADRIGDGHEMVGPRPIWTNILIGKSYGMEIDSGEVDPDDDEVDEIGHGFESGDGPFQVSKNGNGLTAGALYWAHRVSADAFSIHTNLEYALAGTPKVDLAANTDNQLLAYHRAAKITDWPYVTLPARQVPDAETLTHGTPVAIYDDVDAAGTCDHTSGVLTGGGAYTSVCIADPAADAFVAVP